MKKFLALLLCLTMLLSLCSCGKTAGDSENEPQNDGNKGETVPEGALTLDVLNSLKTREDMADLFGIDNEELKQMLVYLKNIYYHLPTENEKSNPGTGTSKTDDGYNSLTVAQARNLITPVVITTENWKEYVEPQMRTIQVSYIDDEGNETGEHEESEPFISVKEGYHCSGTGECELKMINNKTGEQFTYNMDYWPSLISYEDGKYYIVTEESSDENAEIVTTKVEFNVDDYTCTYADAVIYKYDLGTDFKYFDSFDEETCDFIYLTEDEAKEAEIEFNPDYAMTFIQTGETNADVVLCGYESIGRYVYTDDSFASYKTEASSKIEIDPADKLTLDVMLGAETKEELAAIIGVFVPDDMHQMMIYLENYYYHLPSKDDPTEHSSEWGKTEKGYNCITLKDAKTYVTPIVLTTENWKDYVQPYMENVYCYSYDDDGNEIMEIEQEPEIGIDSEKYSSPWDKMEILIKNNLTGETFKYTRTSEWGEDVSVEENGVYSVRIYDENGVGTFQEFDINNYTCLVINAVIYSVDIDPKLCYVEYYDSDAEDWVAVPKDQYKGEDEEYASSVVFVQYGETASDVSTVGLNSLGEHVFINN